MCSFNEFKNSIDLLMKSNSTYESDGHAFYWYLKFLLPINNFSGESKENILHITKFSLK